MKKNYMWAGVIVLVAVGFFYGGMLYGKNSVANKTAGANWQNQAGRGVGGQAGQAGMRRNGVGGAAGGGFVNGEIISQDDKSLTVKLNDGGSKIVFLSEKTTINKMVTGTVADLAVGKTVMVSGSSGSDGSVTAESIQLRPAGIPQSAPGSDSPAK